MHGICVCIQRIPAHGIPMSCQRKNRHAHKNLLLPWCSVESRTGHNFRNLSSSSSFCTFSNCQTVTFGTKSTAEVLNRRVQEILDVWKIPKGCRKLHQSYYNTYLLRNSRWYGWKINMVHNSPNYDECQTHTVFIWFVILEPNFI